MKKRVMGIFAAAVCGILGYTFYSPYGEIDNYRADIQAQPIEGITQNLSALTWNPSTGTLFSTINKPAQIVELSTDGQLLRKIYLSGLKDPEAIEYIDGNRYVVADERQRRLYEVEITPATRHLDVQGAPSLMLNIADIDNNSGFEGLAWNRHDQRLVVAQEKKPVKLLRIDGFASRDKNRDISIEVVTHASWMKEIGDISALDYDAANRRILVMSDHSKKILFIAPHHAVKQLTLDGGKHGLQAPIPQPEGVATDDQAKHIFMVSEPNLFYRLSARKPAEP